jgi:hypothetical protein
VIHYEIVVLDPEKFTSMAQMLMCCSNAGLQWQTRNRSTAREKNGGLTQLLALEQSGGRTGALLSALEKYRLDGKKFVRIFF